MQLPKRQLPQYTSTLPISGEEFTYRPYTVGEEKILMMAATSESESDHVTAIKQVVDNCTNIDTNAIHPTDLEWAYIQLRKTSTSSIVEVNYTVAPGACGKETSDVESTRPCPQVIQTSFNLNNVDITSNKMEEFGTRRADGSWIVKLEEDVAFQIRITTNELDGSDDVVYNMVQAIIVGEEVYTKDMFTIEEFTDWVDENISPTGSSNLGKFFAAIPQTTVSVSTKCQVCKKEFTYDIKGVSGFLM